MNLKATFSEYLKKSPIIKEINYWNLPPTICVELLPLLSIIKLRGRSITIKRLCALVGRNLNINGKISSILFYRNSRKLPIKFPFSLDNIDFVELYSLMLSEGSKNTEFRLHVPEEFFHEIFVRDLKNLFGEEIKKYIIQKKEKGILRSTAPTVIRYLIPICEHIPKLVLKNKKYCKRYLQIAFEAEGSPIFIGFKRYISLKRNVDITDIVKNKLDYPEEERIYIGRLRKDFPEVVNKVMKNPPITLLGEHLMLKEHFNIKSIMKPEAIRVNKTSSGFGKITARWALYIYADSVNRFINEINFISMKKKGITEKMIKIKGYKSQYSTLEIIKAVSKNKIFKISDFVKQMKKIGYVSPMTYICRYEKKGLLERIERGKYRLLIN
jgi:hypothetical protein